MKKWNKKIENKLQELMMRAYPVTANILMMKFEQQIKKIKEYIQWQNIKVDSITKA